MTVFASRFPLLRRAASALLLTGWVVACGPDLQPEPGEPPPEDPPENPQDTHLRHVDNGDGTFTTTVDATNQTEWIGLDLDTRRQENANEDAKWDVAFQRFHVRSRGGSSGTGGVEVAMLAGADLTQVLQAPQAGYAVDAVDGEDADTHPDTPFEVGEGWYSYDLGTHKLTPRTQVYVVRSDAGAFFKLQFTSYYDTAGTPGMLQLRWGPVLAPGASELQMNAESSGEWVYLQAGKGVVQVQTGGGDRSVTRTPGAHGAHPGSGESRP
ncbi:HmuY family protein [Stigmatella hybrida]|uniref:HmuY family protein n=1 Tax=Stigmatella hybrida TaxID=394097 RepID=UPI001CDA77A5|nr:HmuY family protein [Stigmatella hybrida]